VKKLGNTIFWVLIFAILMFGASTIYNRMKPSTIDKFSDSVKEDTLPKDREATQSEDKEKSNAKNDEDTDDSGEDTSEKEVFMAPDFTIEDMEGNKVSLSDYRGKIVFLNFWATWCGFCVREMPDFDEANKVMEEEGDAIILAVNVQEELDKAKEFMENNNLSLPVLMDYTGEASMLYGIHTSGIPVTYVIDKEGALYGRILGATNYDTIIDVLENIRNGSED
jgi:cytochrome c biogenesis protein CcmG/thiol:disulfide interchange protein DsbE